MVQSQLMSFLMGGTALVIIKELLKTVSPENAAIVLTFPVTLFSAFLLKDKEKSIIYAKRFIKQEIILLFLSVFFIYFSDNFSNNLIFFISLIFWFIFSFYVF